MAARRAVEEGSILHPLDSAAMDAARELLAWYDRHRRDLPWRRTPDPYRVWLSEIMLQQTRVEVVIPYFERFLERFPSVEDLAAAPLEEVLARWSGLGYYRRARQLHAAAERLAAEGFPETAEGWKSLPGVGDYTAAAVSSIAFGEAVPVLDGNVERVVARFLAVPGDPKRAATRRVLRAGAGELVDGARPGDSNQALMELGATLCTPAGPRCLLCPLADGCAALQEGRPEAYPELRKRRPPVRVCWVAAAVARDGRRLLFRRGDEEELLAGIWELPTVEAGVETGGEGSAEVLERAFAERYGGRWALGAAAARVRHAITHRAIEVEVRWAEVANLAEDGREEREAGWFTAAEVAELATSSLVAKVERALGSTARRHRSRRRPG